MKDIKEVIYGKDYSNKHKLMMESFDKIEQKHIDFFKERPGRNDFNEHDRLHNHYGIITQYGTIRFGISQDSDLPKEIADDCVKVFNEIWGKKQ